jgi:hypothetical protein
VVKTVPDFNQPSDKAAERIRALEEKLSKGKHRPVPFIHEGLLRFNADVPAEDIEPPEGVITCG